MSWFTNKKAESSAIEVEFSQEQTDTALGLLQSGFTPDEIVSMQWLRRHYQTGGSDRADIIRHLEFLKFLWLNGKI